MRSFRMFIVIMTLAAVVSCENETQRPIIGTTVLDERETPLENREAEEAALWVSGEAYVPLDLYDIIRADFAAIRAEYVDSIPALSIEFEPPWISTEMIVVLSEEARDAFMSGQPTEFHELNEEHGVVSVDTSRLNVRLNTRVFFHGRRNPARLGQIYSVSDEITGAYPNAFIGDSPNFYPAQIGSVMTYFLREAWGDCPAGCAYNEFWYFRRIAGETQYLGSFVLEQGAEFPVWWDEAYLTLLRFWGY